MALEIKSPPVLTRKTAADFYKKVLLVSVLITLIIGYMNANQCRCPALRECIYLRLVLIPMK